MASITHATAKASPNQTIKWRKLLRHNLTAYLFLLPAIILFIYFVWYPVAQTFILSFQKVSITWTNPKFIGLRNFELLFANPLFWKSWKNTFFFATIALLFGYLVPVVLAIAVNEMGRAKDYFRWAFYLPTVLPAVVTIVMWRFFFYPTEGGLVNIALSLVGIEPQKWLSDPHMAMWAILIMAVWAGAGGAMLLYLAALQGIPASLYEAAEVDGAGLWHRIRHIVMPQIRFIMLLTLVGQIIGTMQVFTEPFVMTGGGPVNSTYTIALLQYDYAFRFSNYGAASALGLLVFVVLGGFSLFYTRMMIFGPQSRGEQ